MIQTGLVSVSFRALTPEEIILLAKEAALSGIEWGSDVHVPVGDIQRAKEVRRLTEEAELSVFAYGSYYRAGDNENPKEDFLPILQTAVALGAPAIRVWAGSKWSWRADEAYVARVIADTQLICDMAKEHGVDICYEYHGWTLTDTRFSAVDTVKSVGRDNMFLYWQPNFTLTEEENVIALKMVMPYMKHVHAFYWGPNEEKFPLAEGKTLWTRFAELIKADKRDHAVMLEFFKDGKRGQCLEDAGVLHTLFQKNQI